MDSSTPPETERLLMSANLHRLRGEINEAEAMVRVALKNDPDDPFIREFLGDLLAQRGDDKEAEAVYRAVLREHPERPQLEEKLARLVLRSTPLPAYTDSGAELRTDRNPVVVAFLSLVFPGAGHYFLGDRVKGLIFGSIALLLLFGMVPAVVGLFQSVAGAVSTMTGPTGEEITPSSPALTGVGQLALLGILFTGLQLYAAYDSFTMARNVYRPG
ncbi:MAG: tetratricopeptide repeat protein [Armatimonadetes bacterium]|nr:tetratricopeptide repeat protein [Armatimonadota bacterium]